MTIAELIGVSFRYGSREVLRGVDVRVEPGETIAIIGSNGAGKSTLIDVLAGDLRVGHGEATFLGRALSTWTARELASRRAYLTQHSRMTFEFAAEDVVALGLQAPDPLLAQAAMERAGVGHLRGRIVTRLSGGERRRVHFARLLAQVMESDRSALVLLDEPTAGLDLRHAQALLATSAELASAQTAVVAVLHDLNRAAAFASRIILMAAGAVLADGAPDAILTPPLLQAAFGFRAHVIPHPDHGRPVVVPVDPSSP